MRRIIFQCHFAVMCMENGLTERKSKSETSAAVANRIAPGKEHFKHMFLQFIWNTGTVIADAYFSHIVSRDCRDPDVRASRSIFDCVVHQVDKHLHDESRIHPNQQRYISAIHCDVMFCGPSVNMSERFRYDVVHDLIRKVQFYAAVRNFCNGKQVFNQSRQPLRIVINVRKNLFPRLFIQHVIAVQQRIRVAGNGGQRGPEIMRNRTLKIGA